MRALNPGADSRVWANSSMSRTRWFLRRGWPTRVVVSKGESSGASAGRPGQAAGGSTWRPSGASTIRCRSGSGRLRASRGIQTFYYNAELFWDAKNAHDKATIPAGTEQSRRRGGDRSFEGSLRHSRNTWTPERSATLPRTGASADELGRRRTRIHSATESARHSTRNKHAAQAVFRFRTRLCFRDLDAGFSAVGHWQAQTPTMPVRRTQAATELVNGSPPPRVAVRCRGRWSSNHRGRGNS